MTKNHVQRNVELHQTAEHSPHGKGGSCVVQSTPLVDCAGCGKRCTLCDEHLEQPRTCACVLLATFIWLFVFTKKVALTPAADRSSSVRAVLTGSGASSNVSATVCGHRDERLIKSLEISWIGQVQCFCKDMQLPISIEYTD